MKTMTLDGNTAVVYISYALSELALVYPITPASPMAELYDEWSAKEKKNLFGRVPKAAQMQSEGGAAGALHGSLTCGALATTYTCSQGLLLMLPNMYKIAGELLPTVMHVSARSIATHALNIFGDHQDVMACRQTGFVMLCSSSVQEAADFALLAHICAYESSLPFLHFFDGFRTSHEVNKIEMFEEAEIRSLWNTGAIERFKKRALTAENPVQRGTAQNPDIYFQNRERCNPYFTALPTLLQSVMDEIAKVCKRQYRLFDYVGARDAEIVAVALGSACSTLQKVAEYLIKKGKRVGVIKVRLYRPFSISAFLEALPKTAKTIVALDRTKESGSIGEPLYEDICTAMQESGRNIQIVGGRYGLGGKEFTPANALAIFKNAELPTPKNHFTVGITDDISNASLPKLDFDLPFEGAECVFYGLGSDGTVGANKNSIRLIGEKTPLFVQGFFEYDSRKSGGATISHLRFGKSPVDAPYLVHRPSFVACHNPSYVEKYDMLSTLREGGTFLLNCPWKNLADLEANLPTKVKKQIAEKRARFFVIDGTKIANGVGLKGKTSTVMQAAFFALHGDILPYTEAKKLLLEDMEKAFSKKGADVVERNRQAIEGAEHGLRQIDYPAKWNALPPSFEKEKKGDAYYRDFIEPILRLKGNTLPVSAFQADGSVPTDTAKLEKHGAPASLPKWIAENCIECNQCAFVCPHACIRPYLFPEETAFPDGFTSREGMAIKGARFRIQVSPLDCMGCGLCAHICPAKEKALVMISAEKLTEKQSFFWEFCRLTPTLPPSFPKNTVKGSQFQQPLFEFSYACAGCGETPYIKLLTQLFGERLCIANATGCSSIYGGSAPVCPYAKNEDGKGPAWANSLFEDNAEFSYGMKLAKKIQGNTESVWIIGGDGWAYDIGFGGLDHILASGENVNILVLDSEVYSNTGGQRSKATPKGAIARFAASGKKTKKKDLGLMATTYGSVYVAQVSMGANKNQLVKALTEAEAYEGVSLVIAYSPCIAHGVYLGRCMEEEKRAVDSGYWLLYRYDPSKEKPFSLDSPKPTLPVKEFYEGENRFFKLKSQNPEEWETLTQEVQREVDEKYAFYRRLADLFNA